MWSLDPKVEIASDGESSESIGLEFVKERYVSLLLAIISTAGKKEIKT